MDFINIFTSLLMISGIVEALVETIKPLYLQLKNAFRAFMGWTLSQELSSYEKRVLTLIVGVVLCLLAGFGVDLPAWNESLFVQCVIAGILVSLGSNVLHLLLSIAIALKGSAEKVKTGGSDFVERY